MKRNFDAMENDTLICTKSVGSWPAQRRKPAKGHAFGWSSSALRYLNFNAGIYDKKGARHWPCPDWLHLLIVAKLHTLSLAAPVGGCGQK